MFEVASQELIVLLILQFQVLSSFFQFLPGRSFSLFEPKILPEIELGMVGEFKIELIGKLHIKKT